MEIKRVRDMIPNPLNSLVAGARFCHYFTPPLRIVLIP
jgi:hypothetical protein